MLSLWTPFISDLDKYIWTTLLYNIFSPPLMHCSGHLHGACKTTAQWACLTLLSSGIKTSPWICDPAASQHSEQHARRRHFPRYFECCDLASTANPLVNFPLLRFSNLLAGYILLAFGYSASGHRPTLLLQQTLVFDLQALDLCQRSSRHIHFSQPQWV